MTIRHPRCIGINANGRRCHRTAALKRNGDLYICTKHDFLLMIMIEDAVSAQTRQFLAFSRWRTCAQAQRLIDARRSR